MTIGPHRTVNVNKMNRKNLDVVCPELYPVPVEVRGITQAWIFVGPTTSKCGNQYILTISDCMCFTKFAL